jgi:hypothetical protein
MRRSPNPWISIPSVSLGLLAGALGWVVTDVSCQTQDASGKVTSCPGWALGVGVLSFLIVTIATALILALVYRSIAEWNEKREG